MSGTRSQPNIVVVLTSQWRASACGYAGDPNARTPHLDRLAMESINFRQAVTPHPFGVFARAAFLTGQFSQSVGVCDYYDPLPKEAKTLAHRFSELGYETSFFGKWQLFERDPSAPVVGEEHAKVVVPEDRRGGFSYWEGFESGFLLNDCFFHGTRIVEPRRFSGYQADVVVDRFFSYKNEVSDGVRPQFSVLSFDAPHPPYAAPANGIERYDEDGLSLLRNVPNDPDIEGVARRELAGYYAHIEAMDGVLGRLIAGLKASGEWEENTLFVFSSVHGDMHGSHGHFRKGWPFDESVRVPFLLRCPDRSLAGESDALVSLLDLGPTLFSLAGGANAWTDAGGSDLSSLIFGKAKGPDHQVISMPSVPPFAKQCPYPWKAIRSETGTQVIPGTADLRPFDIEFSAFSDFRKP